MFASSAARMHIRRCMMLATANTKLMLRVQTRREGQSYIQAPAVSGCNQTTGTFSFHVFDVINVIIPHDLRSKAHATAAAQTQRIVAITDAGGEGLIALAACQAYVKALSNSN